MRNFTVATSLSAFLILGVSAGTARAQASPDASGSGGTTTIAAPSMPRVKDLFAPLDNDFKRLATKPNPWVLGIGTAGTVTARVFDRRLADMQWSDGAAKVLGPGRIVGGFVAQTGAAIATYAIGHAIDKPGVATLGADLFRAQVVTQGTTQLIKLTTQRTRPDGSSLSFPSGHTSASFATAAVLQAHYGKKAGLPAYIMASWVAASRMQARRHYLSDVVAGATLGILVGKTITVGRGQATFAITPMAAPGGVGVSFTRVLR
jgi:membrane-associated phospholipid phosphatase